MVTIKAKRSSDGWWVYLCITWLGHVTWALNYEKAMVVPEAAAREIITELVRFNNAWTYETEKSVGNYSWDPKMHIENFPNP